MSTNNGRVPRAEALEVLRVDVERRTFSPETALDDVKYAYNVLQWLMAAFTDHTANSTVMSGVSYPTKDLPATIGQTFLTKPLSDGPRFDLRARSVVRMDPDMETIPAHIPILQSLRDQGMNFPQMLEHFTRNPADLEGSRMAKCYVLLKYAASIQPGIFHEADWGLRFVVAGDSINVLPYGKDGETEPAVNWMYTFRERPHVLAEVATYIGLLTVECETNGVGSVDERYMRDFPAMLEFHRPPDVPYSYISDGTVDAVILDSLVQRGIVSKADLTSE